MTPVWSVTFAVAVFGLWLVLVVRRMKRMKQAGCSFWDARRHHGQREADRLRWAATGYTPQTFFEPQWTCPCGLDAQAAWINGTGRMVDPPQ